MDWGSFQIYTAIGYGYPNFAGLIENGIGAIILIGRGGVRLKNKMRRRSDDEFP